MIWFVEVFFPPKSLVVECFHDIQRCKTFFPALHAMKDTFFSVGSRVFFSQVFPWHEYQSAPSLGLYCVDVTSC